MSRLLPCPTPGRRRTMAALTASAALLLTACGGQDEPSAGGATANDEASVTVVSGFFPLTELAQKVGGDRVEVTQVAPDGSDPHHTEMTPQTTGRVQEADLVLHVSTMQPALDAAIQAVAADRAWDVGEAVDLEAGPQGTAGEAPSGQESHGSDHGDESSESHAGHDHAGDAQAGHEHEGHGHEGHDHGGVDPHFWLDPLAYARAAESLGERLAQQDPEHAEEYRDNARQYVDQLKELDRELQQQLASCRITDMVVGHEAYGWFGARYGLHQLGVAGIANGAEVSPARLAELSSVVRSAGVTTIYAEPLSPRDNAQALADETGTQVAVLDPAAGLGENSAARDYLGIMRANAETLRAGQECG